MNAGDWFGDINESKARWGYEDKCFNYSDIWSQQKLEEWVKEHHPDLSATRQKGIIQPMHYFRELSSDFLDLIADESFWKSYSKDDRDYVIRNLRKYWERAKQSYFDKETMKWSCEGHDYEEDLAFGPWIWWKHSDCRQIEYAVTRYNNTQRRECILTRRRSTNQTTKPLTIRGTK